jgi:hypothetical protein
VIQQKGAVDVRCSCIDVVHGRFAPDCSAYGTLLVLQFRFDSRQRARRIASADIFLEFSGIKPGGSRPEVYAISPDGRLGLVQTTQHEEITKGGDIELGVGAVQGLKAKGYLSGRKLQRGTRPM